MTADQSLRFEFRDMPCAVCGSEAKIHLGWRGGSAHHDGQGVRTEIVRCQSCTHLYPSPMPFPLSLGGLYDNPEEYFVHHDVEEKKRLGRELLSVAQTKLNRRGTILDIGCGRGEILWAAREAGWNCVGVDPSPSYIDWGQRNLGVKGIVGTLEESGFPDEHFDVVVMGGVIEHLYEPSRTAREVWRVLKPGGVFYLDAPNEDGLYMAIGNFYLRAQRRDWVVNLAPTFSPFHVQGFNPRSLKQLLRQSGFEIDEFGMGGKISPFTGNPSVRKKIEHRVAKLINWLGNRCGKSIYMDVWLRKPERS